MNERGARRPVLGFLGDISYATYLLHFPMQLALALVADRLDWEPQVFMQGWVLLAFYAALIGLGALSFHLFERPMQAWLRRTLMWKSSVAASG